MIICFLPTIGSTSVNIGEEQIEVYNCADDCPIKIIDEQSNGASRYFYCAKVSKKERGEGNNHPTLKPISLLTYLIKLITPIDGVVLDPFMGSGSAGIAAINAGYDYIGIEMTEEYYKIAQNRINKQVFPLKREINAIKYKTGE